MTALFRPKAHRVGKAGCFQSKNSWNQKLYDAVHSCKAVIGYDSNRQVLQESLLRRVPESKTRVATIGGVAIYLQAAINKILFGSTIAVMEHSRGTRSRRAAKQAKRDHQMRVMLGHEYDKTRPMPSATKDGYHYDINLRLTPEIIHRGNKSDLREEQQQASQRYSIMSTRSLQKGKLFLCCLQTAHRPSSQ